MEVEAGSLRILADYLTTLEDFLLSKASDMQEQRIAYIQRELNLSRAEVERAMEDDVDAFMLKAMASFEPEFWGLPLYEYDFPTVLRASFFLALYAWFEYSFDVACRDLQRVMNLRLSLRDLAGKGVNRARTYLVKVAQLDFPASREWQEVTYYSKLRNCIAHNDGRLAGLPAKQAKDLRKYISRHPYLQLQESPVATTFELQRGFCEEAIVNIDAVYQQLLDCCHTANSSL